MGEQNKEKAILNQIPHQILDLMLDVIIEVMRAERGSIMLLEGDSQELTIKSSRGLRNEIIEKTRVRLGNGIAGKVAVSGEAVFLKGISGERRFGIKNEDLINHDIDTSYIVPIKTDQGTFGTINIHSTNPNHEIRADKEGLVQMILHRFFEYITQVELPSNYHESPSQLYMMNIFQEYNMLRELRGIFDFTFGLVTALLKIQKKGIFFLKNQDSDFFDLVLGYGFDTERYNDIYEELVPCLKRSKVESARNITIFNREELFSTSVSLFQEDFYILLPLIRREVTQGYVFLFAGALPSIDEATKKTIQLICEDAARTIAESATGKKFHEIAFTDNITGTYNYGLWWERLREEFSRMQRLKDPLLSLIIFDIDHFNRFNLSHGYLMGDQLLRVIADRLKSCLRINDIVGRIGEDEFGIVLPDTSKQDSLLVSGRILDAVSGIPVEMRIHLSHPLTLSGGLACFPFDADTPGKLVESAKTALVSAKIMGGNCIKSFDHFEE